MDHGACEPCRVLYKETKKWCIECCCCSDPRLYPKMSVCSAQACLIVNCLPFTAGFGTIISSCCGEQDCSWVTKTVICGIL